MQLHDIDSRCVSATLHRFRSETFAWRVTWGFALVCTLLIACGDDGTDGLSSCPEGKIALDKNNLLRCAPVGAKQAGAGGSSGKPGVAGAKSTSSIMPANTAAKPAPAGSSAPGAANGGGAGAKPAAASGEPNNPPAGSNPPAAGGNTPSGGAPPAAMSGSGNPPEIPSGPWSCLQYMDACSCVPSEGLGDSCTKPHPPCCTYVTMNGKVVACVCVPADSAQCNGMKSDPTTYPSASKCPP